MRLLRLALLLIVLGCLVGPECFKAQSLFVPPTVSVVRGPAQEVTLTLRGHYGHSTNVPVWMTARRSGSDEITLTPYTVDYQLWPTARCCGFGKLTSTLSLPPGHYRVVLERTGEIAQLSL